MVIPADRWATPSVAPLHHWWFGFCLECFLGSSRSQKFWSRHPFTTELSRTISEESHMRRSSNTKCLLFAILLILVSASGQAQTCAPGSGTTTTLHPGDNVQSIVNSN